MSAGDHDRGEETTRAISPLGSVRTEANASHPRPTASRAPQEATGDPSVSRATTARSSVGKTIQSVADVLEEEERTRTRLLGIAGLGVNVLALGALPLFGGTPSARAAFLIGLVIHAAANVGLYVAAKSPDRFTARWLLPVWCASFVGLHLVIYFFGTVTVAAIALMLGLYIVSTTRFPVVAQASFVVVTMGTALMAGLQLGGVLPDAGIVPLRTATTTQTVGMLVLLEAMFFAVRFIGVGAGKSLEQALEALGRAQRALAQREALLEEARDEFDRLQAKGARGRFSGTRVDRFELGERLGTGGMGEVYEATGPDGAPAAVKVLTREASHQPDVLRRFFRESEIVGRLDSPHVVRVLHTGGPPADVPFIAMERLVGEDLSAFVRQRGSMALDEVVRMVREVGRGLQAAAVAGVVHRDVKPNNIFRLERSPDGIRYKVLDFGVSKLRGSEGTLTEGQVVGTPSYMAPEQALGESVDHRADLYGLAAVAYRCLLGRPPFKGRDTTRVLLDVVQHMPPRPSAIAEVPPELDAVFALALAKSPADRFTEVTAFATALEAAGRGHLDDALRRRADRLLAALPWRDQRRRAS
ncbi:MAG: serine/threonine-protein kinase [Myxococcota bacterium]